MHIKRYPLLVVLILSFWSGFAMAQSVVADGVGTDRESALRDASRNAVEEVVGTMVDSKTLVQDNMVKLDTIYTKAQGFVTDVQLLQENVQDGMTHVRAKIEVNTDPDAQLMNNLRMIMALNDPRIAVIIENADGSGRNASAEAALNQKLLTLGFNHIVDPAVTASLQEAKLLGSLASGDSSLAQTGQSLGADYLVMGKVSVSGQDISLPDGQGGYQKTLLKTGDASMTAKIIRFDTGEIIGTFATTGRSAGNSLDVAEQAAVTKASAEAAQKLEEKFRHLSAATGQSVELQVYTSDQAAVDEMIKELQQLAVVQNVYLREFAQGRAVISVETTESVSSLLQLFKAQTHLGVFVDRVTNSSAKLSVSR